MCWKDLGTVAVGIVGRCRVERNKEANRNRCGRQVGWGAVSQPGGTEGACDGGDDRAANDNRNDGVQAIGRAH
jgi:hypothetical protein